MESAQNYQNDIHKNGYQFEYGKTVRLGKQLVFLASFKGWRAIKRKCREVYKDTRRTGIQLDCSYWKGILHTHVTNRLKDGTKLQDQTSTNDKTADMNNSKAEKEEKTEPILTECYPQKMKS